MHLQSSTLHSHVSLSSTQSYSCSLASGFCSVSFPPSFARNNNAIVCSTSNVRSYGHVDYEKRSTVKWSAIYRRISLMENPEMGSAYVLNQVEHEGKKPSKWELCRVVKELRKFRNYKLALEVYEWMNEHEEKYKISTSDTAIQVDLIAKVQGITDAEDYFLRLPDKWKDGRTYAALLNAYVRTRMKEKAELLLNRMKNKRYAMSPLPFNVMMTLYMKLKEYEKVDSTIAKMMEKDIQLDIYSYNIWLSSRGSQGSSERMEQILEQMKLDRTISPDWTTFSTMATMYIKLGQFEKAEGCLKKVETRILGQDYSPYHYLIRLYGCTGNKDEVYRVWNIYKSNFPYIRNLGYHAVISSLGKIGDFEGAKKIYDDWLVVKSRYDPRIGNVFLGWYVKEGSLEEAEDFFDHMVEVGAKPNSRTWEILAEGHIRERMIPEALSCLKEAGSVEGSKGWMPSLANVSSLFKQCEEEADMESKQVLMALLRDKGCLAKKAYASLLGISNGPLMCNDLLSSENERTKDDNDNDNEEGLEDEGAQMFFDELKF